MVDSNNSELDIVKGEFQARLENSDYYKLLSSTLRSMQAAGNDQDRAYVSALSLCFNIEYVEAVPISSIAGDHGFDVDVSHRIGLVLARNQLIKFCVTDCLLPHVNRHKIRAASPASFSERFGRAPRVYGQSDMWCSIGEWYVLLGLGRPPMLPQVIRDFAAENDVSLPD